MRSLNLSIVLGLIIISLVSCGLGDSDKPIPFYLDLKSPTVFEPNGNTPGTHKITEAWVFADGQIQGVFPVPGIAPLHLISEKTEIKVLAGIKNNGMNDNPVFYPFLKEIPVVLSPVANKTYPVPLNFSYVDAAKYSVNENFEGSHIFTFNLDNKPGPKIVSSSEQSRTGFKSGEVVLTKSNNFVEVATQNSVPKGFNARGESYVEFDYKGEGEIAVGIAKSQNGVFRVEYILFVPAKSDWNHIYAEFTDKISPNDFDNYKMILAFTKTGSSAESKIYIDNYKHVHF
jgi:hypothetical protein